MLLDELGLPDGIQRATLGIFALLQACEGPIGRDAICGRGGVPGAVGVERRLASVHRRRRRIAALVAARGWLVVHAIVIIDKFQRLRLGREGKQGARARRAAESHRRIFCHSHFRRIVKLTKGREDDEEAQNSSAPVVVAQEGAFDALGRSEPHGPKGSRGAKLFPTLRLATSALGVIRRYTRRAVRLQNTVKIIFPLLCNFHFLRVFSLIHSDRTSLSFFCDSATGRVVNQA